MQKRRLRIAAGATSVAVIAAGALAVGAGGQAGPPAGTLEFDVVWANGPGALGYNTVTGHTVGDKPGQQKYPRIGDVIAYNGKVVMDGRSVGRADGSQVVTDRGNGRLGGDVAFLSNEVIHIGGEAIALGATLQTLDRTAVLSGPVAGGTGRYAGAEGTFASKLVEDTPERQTEHYTLTFVP